MKYFVVLRGTNCINEVKKTFFLLVKVTVNGFCLLAQTNFFNMSLQKNLGMSDQKTLAGQSIVFL